MPEKQRRPQDSAQRAAWAAYIGAGFYPVKQEIALHLHFFVRTAQRTRTNAETFEKASTYMGRTRDFSIGCDKKPGVGCALVRLDGRAEACRRAFFAAGAHIG